MVYIPWEVVDDEKTFVGFYHINETSWAKVMPVLEDNWKTICEYIEEHGLDALKKRASANFAGTQFLQLFRCKDRISTKTGRLRKPALRLKINWGMMKQLMEGSE